MAKPSRSPEVGAAPPPAALTLAALSLAAAVAACGAPAAPSPGEAGAAAATASPPAPDADALARPAGDAIGPFRSDHGEFEVWYRSEPAPVPLNALHAWVVRVVDAGGAPVGAASIAVSGGCRPKVTRTGCRRAPPSPPSRPRASTAWRA